MQFGFNKYEKVYQTNKIWRTLKNLQVFALSLSARAIFLRFDKFSRVYLFQIALEIMRFLVNNNFKKISDKQLKVCFYFALGG